MIPCPSRRSPPRSDKVAPPGMPSALSTTASHPESHRPSGGIRYMRPPVGPPVGPNTSYPNQMPLPPGPSLMSSIHNRSYGSASSSPAPGQPGDQFVGADNSPAPGGTPGLSQAQLSSAGLQAQKRAYRQRRKDPSCDACRERKVKCDATDTSSCSECLSRNVKCQFTKETNRRMSSIKQVQDLEKQLEQARQQLNHLRMLMKENGSADLEKDSIRPPVLDFPGAGSKTRKRQEPLEIPDLQRLRANLRIQGRGVIRPPPPYRPSGYRPRALPHLPTIPPKHVADHLLTQYYSSIHPHIPILHWPSFTQEYETVYRNGSLQGVPPVWGSLLFSIFACGTLYTTDASDDQLEEGKMYLEGSRMLIDLWADEFTLDHARSTLLTSVFLTERNLKSAGWVWLGSALRISQDIGLHYESGTWPVIESEMRRRVWWAIYIWDRLLSLELGRPVMIDDRDCDVDLPSPLDDHFIQASGIFAPPDAPEPTGSLLVTIYVVHPISQLLKSFREPFIASHTLQAFDKHFKICMAAFPPHCRITASEYLEPRFLAPIIYLQNARIVLHSHNLSPACAREVRMAAIGDCVAAAKDTVQLLSRTMQTPTSSPRHVSTKSPDTWQGRLVTAASGLLCTHIWRCVLFLCFRGEYSAALLCVRWSAAIGDTRPVNAACGRHLTLFLNCLVTSLRRDDGSDLEDDEELIAYVSADIQNSNRNSWIWQDSALDMKLDHTHSQDRDIPDRSYRRKVGRSSSATVNEDDVADWDGWERLEWILQHLLREQQQRTQAIESAAQTKGEPGSLEAKGNVAVPRVSPRNSDRISIANII